jgi:hypothetical protein
MGLPTGEDSFNDGPPPCKEIKHENDCLNVPRKTSRDIWGARLVGANTTRSAHSTFYIYPFIDIYAFQTGAEALETNSWLLLCFCPAISRFPPFVGTGRSRAGR